MLTAQLATLLLSVCSTGDTVLLDFRADWCGPCRSMDPVVQQLSAAGYPVRQVNIDNDHDLAAKYHIGSIPCFVLLVNGREVDRVTGASGSEPLMAMFQKAGVTPGSRTADASSRRGSSTPGKAFPSEISSAPLGGGKAFGSSVAAGANTLGNAANMGSSPESWIACCVRLKVADPKGNSVGSGTIIDARQGEALVLTCGHIFRDSDGKGEIFVDMFGEGAPQHVAGRLLSCDLERDVALVGMKIKGSVAVAHVAPAGYVVHKGDRVIGIGCSNGADPTVQESRVNSLDRFQGPANIQVAGQPVQGRSGGGLFNADGQVIGVCNAADPSDNEGLFAAPESIYKELDRAGLTFVYRPATGNRGGGSAARESALAVRDPAARDDDPNAAAAGLPEMPDKMPWARRAGSVSATDLKGQLSKEEIDTLAELQAKAQNAEVICIVRPSAPGAKSEIIVLDKASPAFLKRLSSARADEDSRGRRLTSLETPVESDGARQSDWLPPAGRAPSTPSWQTRAADERR